MCLISPAQLRRRVAEPGTPAMRICDVRWWLTDPGKGRRDYDAAHLPGAIFIDADTDLVGSEGPGRHPLPDPAVFASRMASIGIGDDTLVVAYDDAGGTIAARLWWMLDDLGHEAVRILDGGIDAWTAEGGPLTAEVPTPPSAPARLHLRDHWSRTIDRRALAARLLAGDVALLDARAPERYRGDLEPIDPVAGHIPGAISRPMSGNLRADGRFLDPGALRRRFEGLTGELVNQCGSGINACHNALAMRIAGLPDPLLYPGSYSDWSRRGMPVATGDDPARYEG